jgi:1-deoxy-D-xylulose-5-phosphate reductoisomerase
MGTVNAANEVAVDAFLNHQIKFLEIPNIIEQTLTQAKHSTLSSLDAIIANDQHARVIALEIVGQHA